MLTDIRKTEQESRWLYRASWVALVLGLLTSGVAWWQAGASLKAQADNQFARQAGDTFTRLDQMVDHYIDVLVSFQAMFMVNEQVPRRTFHQHYIDLNAEDEYPAMLAVQYAQLVPLRDKTSFEASVRQDRSLSQIGYPHFQIHPAGNRATYLPIVFNEPMTRNMPAFGYDILSKPVLQDVVDRARDVGKAQSSPPLELIQGGQGIVMRLPVYKPQLPLDTLEARRRALTGTISGIFRTSDLMLQAANPAVWQDLHWVVTDTGPSSAPAKGPAVRLFDSAAQTKNGHRATATPQDTDVLRYELDVGGRHWAMSFTRRPVNAMAQPYPLALLLGGIMGSLGLWWALRSAATRHAQAAAMAQQLSHKAQDSEHRLRSVLDHTIDGILTIAPSGRILSVNQAVCRTFGHNESAIVGEHLSKLLPAAGHNDMSKRIDTFMQVQCVGMDGVGRRTEGRRASGQSFPLDMAVSSMELDGAKQYIAVVRDLSSHEAAERAIMEAQRQLNEVDEMRRVIVHNAPYAIFVLNTQGIIQTVNPSGEKLLGYRAHELVGRCTTQRFFDPDQIAERAQLLALRLNQPVAELDVLPHLANESPGLPSEWSLLRQDGSHLVAEILVTELRNEFGVLTGYLAMAHDVTSRREAETQLQHMALHDALTALPNRNMLQEQLKACLNIAERDHGNMALMFLDLDRFKKINDSLGHHIGDSVLIEIARRLRAAMRTSDIVARLGGDEFVILLPRITEEDDGEHVARKVLDQFIEPLRIGPHELRVTPSIGLALYPQHGTDAITLMRHADLAMYQAKNNGRNRVQVYSDKMQSPSADTLVLENDLYHALSRNELRLHFQPQFNCATGRITGAEALLRWEHKGRLIPPSDFIPLAEETGLIVAMGEWVLRHACARAHAWRQQTGWPLRMAVNLSAVQLDRDDVVDTVARALRDTGLEPTALELEITESVVVRESLRAADVLTQLRALGVSIAIDDFGVGYSSFSYLRELPVDRFKLDRSFLSNVPDSTGDSRLVAALIAMGHRLEVGIVAEGVENETQLAFLQDHGCDEVQGYHLARPLKEADFESLLLNHQATHPAQAQQALLI